MILVHCCNKHILFERNGFLKGECTNYKEGFSGGTNKHGFLVNLGTVVRVGEKADRGQSNNPVNLLEEIMILPFALYFTAYSL